MPTLQAAMALELWHRGRPDEVAATWSFDHQPVPNMRRVRDLIAHYRHFFYHAEDLFEDDGRGQDLWDWVAPLFTDRAFFPTINHVLGAWIAVDMINVLGGLPGLRATQGAPAIRRPQPSSRYGGWYSRRLADDWFAVLDNTGWRLFFRKDRSAPTLPSPFVSWNVSSEPWLAGEAPVRARLPNGTPARTRGHPTDTTHGFSVHPLGPQAPRVGGPTSRFGHCVCP